MKRARPALDLEALTAIVEQTRSRALNETEHRALEAALARLAELACELEKKRTSIQRLQQLLFGAKTEKTENVLPHPPSEQNTEPSTTGDGEGSGEAAEKKEKTRPGHGRNGAEDYPGAEQVEVKHPALSAGEACPLADCEGRLSRLRDPGVILRVRGTPPLSATLYSLEKLRCSLCGTLFTAPPPEGIAEHKYEVTAASMIACLKYGAGFPFNRLEKLQDNLGIPLPASTQWDIVHALCLGIKPAWEALLEAAAQGEVLHNDDTPMKILELMGQRGQPQGQSPDAGGRSGIFTSGVLSKHPDHSIALFFTGRQHAGENLQSVLEQRSRELGPPIQMCDGLSRNLPKELQTLLANCLSHGRRYFVDVVANFPDECRFVLETLGTVYTHDARARDENLSPEERLLLHQRQSGPPMEALRKWLKCQIDEHRVEPNSGVGQAITYMRNHWQALTLFLRAPGAPLDNNICERLLKKAILHRKNALFYKTQNGARVGDLFMSLIHTAELSGVNAFDYLCTLQRHSTQLHQDPAQWMPWNYQQTLQRIAAQP